MAAGKLRERLKFQKRGEPVDDGYGNTVTDWVDQFTVSARVKPRLGSEPIIAQRLQGVQPVTITVRASSDTRQIAPDWRAIDTRDATKVYNLRTAAADEKDRFIEMLADDGAAT
jgi:SPP1 family predicted phage head-tail adaptor